MEEVVDIWGEEARHPIRVVGHDIRGHRVELVLAVPARVAAALVEL